MRDWVTLSLVAFFGYGIGYAARDWVGFDSNVCPQASNYCLRKGAYLTKVTVTPRMFGDDNAKVQCKSFGKK